MELITAPEPVDDLTRYYRRLLDQGDGGAFLALHPSEHEQALVRLSRAGLPASAGINISFPYDHPLRYLFFAGLNHSPTDRPEHFAHANTALRLSAVWLAGDSFADEQLALDALGLTISPSAPDFPFLPEAGMVRLADGALYLLPARHARLSRRVVGVTLDVRDLATAVTRLESAAVPFRRLAAATGRRSVVVNPDNAHGIWLELRQ